jgi:acetyl esterase/lipase
MKFDAEKLRREFGASDQKRDAGLTTPDNIKRYDDIAYGEYGRYNLLDIYHKKDVTSPQKTIIDIHGGGWTYGDKDVYQHYCMDMARRGFTVVNFSYRLSPEDPYPAALEDINAVFTWVAENAAAYNIDLDKICVTGDSAGAQLASQYLALLTNSAFRKLFPMQIPHEQIKVKAVALNCGCYDMKGRVEAQEDDPFLAYIDKALTENRELTLEQIDTVKYINADFPPAYIMSAEYDFLKEHVKPMYELLRAKGIVCEWKLYGKAEDTYMGHVFHLNQRLEEAKICNDNECRFFDEILGA